MSVDNQVRQQGNSSNNSVIVNYGSGNTTSLNQAHSSFRDGATELRIDPSSIERLSPSDVTSSAITVIVAVLGLAVFGFIADITDIMTYFGLSRYIFLPILLVGCMGIIAINRDKLRLLYIRTFRPDGIDDSCIGDGRVAHLEPDGGFTIYHMLGKCIYPKCSGSVCLTDAPPRERKYKHRRYVGVCSVGRWDHGYYVTKKGVAMPCQLDLGPLSEKTKDH